MTLAIKQALILCGALLALSAPSPPQTLSALAPFDFQVGDRKMLAGSCRVYNFGALELKCISTPHRPSYVLKAPSDTIDRRAGAIVLAAASTR